MTANLNAIVFDFVTRQKVQGQTLNLFIIEQLPVVPPDHYTTTRFGPKTAAEIVQAAVLELTYTAHDMAPFARDMGHVDAAGEVLPPFPWDEARRLQLRAKLDALFFHLYEAEEKALKNDHFPASAQIDCLGSVPRGILLYNQPMSQTPLPERDLGRCQAALT